MADNVPITSGTGTTIKTDQLAGGEHVQYVKIMDGTADSSTVLTVSSTLGLPTYTQGNVANAATDSGNPVKIAGVYRSSSPTYSDGQRAELLTTVNGFLRVELASLLGGEDLTNNVLGVVHKPVAASTYALSTDNQMTQVTKRTSKAVAGNVFSFCVTNDNAAARYFQLHNKASAPAGGDVPVRSYKIPAGTANNPGELKIGRDILGEGGEYLSTGVSWAISTTYGTFTDSATASEHIVVLKYI